MSQSFWRSTQIRSYFLNLFFRSSGIGFRFLIPISIIFLDKPDELGLYYLATSIMAGVSIFGGMELALFFSIKFKQKENILKQEIVANFFWALCAFNLFLIFFVISSVALWSKNLPELFFLIILALAVESVSYEVGRFFWNLGEVKKVSLRDFFRPLGFAISILVSLYLHDKILTLTSLIIFIVINSLIVFIEMKSYTFSGSFKRTIYWIRNLKIKIFLREFLNRVGPQFLQNQILAALLILERTIFTVVLGLAFLGSYAFVFSVISTISHLIYMPMILKVREIIIANQVSNSDKFPFEESVKLLWVVIFVTFIMCLLMAIIGQKLAISFGKELDFSPIVIITVGISSITYAFAAAVSPLFSHKNSWVLANTLTFISSFPMLIVLYDVSFFGENSKLIVLSSILTTAILQLIFRITFFKFKIRSFKSAIH